MRCPGPLLLALFSVACRPAASSSPPPPVEPTPVVASVSATPAGPTGSVAPVASASEAERATALAMALIARMPAADPRAMDDENAAVARKVIEGLVTASRSKLRLDGCRMYPGTRAGHCLFSGSPDDTRQFIAGLHLKDRDIETDNPPASFSQTCLTLPEFGVHLHGDEGNGPRPDILAPRKGTRSFTPGAALPPNRDNVHVRWLYTSPSRRAVCLEFNYPYG